MKTRIQIPLKTIVALTLIALLAWLQLPWYHESGQGILEAYRSILEHHFSGTVTKFF